MEVRWCVHQKENKRKVEKVSEQRTFVPRYFDLIQYLIKFKIESYSFYLDVSSGCRVSWKYFSKGVSSTTSCFLLPCFAFTSCQLCPRSPSIWFVGLWSTLLLMRTEVRSSRYQHRGATSRADLISQVDQSVEKSIKNSKAIDFHILC